MQCPFSGQVSQFFLVSPSLERCPSEFHFLVSVPQPEVCSASAVSLPSPTILNNVLPNLVRFLKFSTYAHLLISPLPAFQVRAAAPQERRSSPAQLFAGLGTAALVLTSGVNPEAANAAWVARPSLEGKVAAPREAVRVARDSLGNLLSDTKSAAENLQV